MKKYDHRKCTFIYLKQSIFAHIHGNGHFFYLSYALCILCIFFICVCAHTNSWSGAWIHATKNSQINSTQGAECHQRCNFHMLQYTTITKETRRW